jgi:hypothetical protein
MRSTSLSDKALPLPLAQQVVGETIGNARRDPGLLSYTWHLVTVLDTGG